MKQYDDASSFLLKKNFLMKTDNITQICPENISLEH